jgi:hypothetical protein
LKTDDYASTALTVFVSLFMFDVVVVQMTSNTRTKTMFVAETVTVS